MEQSREQKLSRNTTLDCMRLVFAVSIVALHTNPFIEYNGFISYFFSQVISRLGVPFFSLLAGYYFFKSNSEEKYKKTFVRYLASYTIWSIVYFIFQSILSINGGQEVLFRSIVQTYLFDGYYHLWYMLAIIYTIIILWIMKDNKKILKYLYGVSLCFLVIGICMFGYGKIFFSIPIFKNLFGQLNMDVNMQTQWLFLVVPFFMTGYILQKNKLVEGVLYKKAELLLGCLFIFYLIEVVLLQILDLKTSTTLCIMTYPVVVLVFICALKHPKVIDTIKGNYMCHIASFLYFSHIMFSTVLDLYGFSETKVFFITIICSVSIGIGIVKCNNRILKKLL